MPHLESARIAPEAESYHRLDSPDRAVRYAATSSVVSARGCPCPGAAIFRRNAMRNHSTAVLAFAAFAVLALATPVVAQTLTDEKELTKSVISTERQAIVSDNMNLTEAQGKVFWPLYREYGAEMDQITDRKLKLMEDYAHKYEGLTDEEASSVMADYFAIQKDEL